MMKIRILETEMDGLDRALRVHCGKNKLKLLHEAAPAPTCLYKYSIRGIVFIDVLGGEAKDFVLTCCHCRSLLRYDP